MNLNPKQRRALAEERARCVGDAYSAAQTAIEKKDWPALASAIEQLRALESGWAGRFQAIYDDRRKT